MKIKRIIRSKKSHMFYGVYQLIDDGGLQWIYINNSLLWLSEQLSEYSSIYKEGPGCGRMEFSEGDLNEDS